MRRYRAFLLAALVFGSAFWLVASLSPTWEASGRVVGSRAAGIFSHLVSGAKQSLESALHCAIGVAAAQEILEFKELPPESVSQLESGRERARRGRTPAPVPTPGGTPPAPPAPEAPKTEVSFGKSGNVMRIGSDVTVAHGQVVEGDLLVVGGDITVEGHVEGDVVAMGGDVHLDATARIDGDVACIGGELTEESGAWVGGQRVTASGAGGLWGLRERTHRDVRQGVRAAARFVSSLIWLLVMAGLAWGVARLAPGRTGAALATLKSKPALSLGIGALVWALVIPSVVALSLVVAILCITIIGIPLALAALLGYFVFLGLLAFWGYFVGGAAVGEWVLSRRSGAAAVPAAEPPAGGAQVSEEAKRGGGPTLAQKTVIGVVVIIGAKLVGNLLQTLFFAPPLPALGSFISAISVVGGILAATFGAGALLRTEFASGALGRWWKGREIAPAAPARDVAAGTPAPPPAQP